MNKIKENNFLVLGFELSASRLLGRHSTTCATALANFAFVIFGIGSLVLLGLDHNPPFYASQIAEIIGMPCSAFG
jgi:hypothetical protein